MAAISPQYYLFFVRDVLPQPAAHLIQVVQCANAAANLGYPSVLSYLQRGPLAWNPLRWVAALPPRPVDPDFAAFYSTQNRLNLLPLPMPWPIDRVKTKLTNASTVACKYYWPLQLRSRTKLVHTRDWNFVKAAIKSGVPVIYECHHCLPHPYEAEIVTNPLLQVAVTVVETVQRNMIANGMPPNKIRVVPNGFNRQFLERHPEGATAWRDQLLPSPQHKLAVYAGALQNFKGVDLLLEIAPQCPDVVFALAGGPVEQQAHYQAQCDRNGLSNVRCLGFLPQNQLAELLQAADVLLHPHRMGPAATFTSPLKLFDYLASGTPIVASEIPSLESFKGTAAISAWCPPDSPNDLIKALRQVLATKPRRAEGYPDMIEYVRQYSWENRIKTILDQVDPALRPDPIHSC
ncbi:MAG TPA: glycosyltransferase [Trichocoleus sp.]